MADNSETRKQQRARARAERVERERAQARRARQRRRLWQLGGAVALAAAIVVVIVIATGGGGSDKPTLQAGESVAGQRAAATLFAGIPQRGITLGRADAPYTMVEFADLQCPFCAQYTEQAEPSVIRDYVRTGRLKLEFRNLTFIGDDSIRAGQMAEAAGLQDKLWTFADVFYANQGEENTGYVTDDFLRRIGGAVAGLDVDRAMDERGTEAVARQLDAADAAARQEGVNQTPTFLVGRTDGTLRPLDVSSLDAAAFTAALDKAIADS